nr:cysteine-rich receptor-like protein kinase 2 [Ipomoea batatas]
MSFYLQRPELMAFTAAAKLQEESPGGATTYAVAQCAETVSERSCKDCLMFLEIFRHPFFC